MYKIGKSRIPWASHGWSPVVGCSRGCPYCYAKGIVSRFGFSWFMTEMDYRKEKRIPEDSLYNQYKSFSPAVMHHRLNPVLPEKPAAIFCSPLSDPEYWPAEALDAFFEVVEGNPHHTFMVLTKNGRTYYNWPNHKNLAFGYTATDADSLSEQNKFATIGGKGITFLSLEPLHGFLELADLDRFDWVIVGPENGSREGKPVPNEDWFKEVYDYCDSESITLFEKPEVGKIIDSPLVQDFPWWHPKR